MYTMHYTHCKSLLFYNIELACSCVTHMCMCTLAVHCFVKWSSCIMVKITMATAAFAGNEIVL